MPRAVVLIVLDCLRADHVSCYGYHRRTTPTIDRLAERGILWEQSYSVSAWTKPSVTSLLTGLYPSQHGAFQGIKRSKNRVEVTTDVLRDSIPTLAESFTGAGWRCGAFINNAQLGPFTRLDRGFEEYQPTAGKADRLIAAFGQWLKADLETPAFAYLHLLEAHWPYKPRRRHIAMFGGNRDTNCFRDYSARDYGRLRRAVSRKEVTLSDGQLEQMVQMYDGAVRRLDGKVKVVMRLLEALGLYDRTALFITADHGEEFLEHGKLGHGQSLYPELTHVPLVALVPGDRSGIRVSEPVSQVDLPHTVQCVAGVKADLPGGNLLSPNGRSSPVCSELRIRRRYAQCLRTAKWSLHRKYKFDPEDGELDESRTPRHWVTSRPHSLEQELYERSDDPHELANVAADREYYNACADMASQLDQWWAAYGSDAEAATAAEIELDPRVVQHLRDLGYLE